MKTPAEWFATIRAALAGEGQGPEWVAFSAWWQHQASHQRRAWYFMAGIPNDYGTKKTWGDMPAKHRAAIVVAVDLTRRQLAGIASASEAAAPRAVSFLERAAA